MDQTEWTDIVLEQPQQGQRVLVKTSDGKVRITSYDRYCYEHWCIAFWKRLPNG